MHEKRFHGNIERLRSPERMEQLQVGGIIDHCLQGVSARSVLDIGIGSGVFAEAFLQHGLTVSGIDINPEMVRIAKRFLPGAEISLGSAEKLPYTDNQFDIAFLGHMLHESDHPVMVLSESHRVTRFRVAALEWPYIHEEHGPPLAHRVQAEAVLAWGKEAGFTSARAVQMRHMVLYLFE